MNHKTKEGKAPRRANRRQVDKEERTVVAAMTRTLPVFEGYTVDERLREFRRMDRERGFETIPFESPRGQALWAAYEDSAEWTFLGPT